MDTYYNDQQELASYDDLFALDIYNSGSSIASSSHLGSPSPQPGDFDMNPNYYGFSLPQMEPGVCFETPVPVPVAVAPQDLHTSDYFYNPSLTAEQESAITQDMFAIPLATDQVSPVTSEAPSPPAVPNSSFPPMKKDREKGKANLKKTSLDPERQNQCTMCIRKFKRRADLARHLKRHEGIRPYECLAKACPLPPDERHFFRADARQRHWKAHPSCEREFYQTPQGIEWMKKNRNRSQKRRGYGRRSAVDSRDTSSDDYNNDSDDADYHD
ncbi:hypothetical protein M408DRAFT_325880 [Serendipita vermifera MAFF 305830]|uniref:C2H2-type domain-containing protein n=1 Tax=Serendipita vermifera MAFF 305830 TaxID=933852 RepID=A0A0C3BSX2_SERVB|nr:hypothetical protein M408DRAFT_325880 [Serendipita vermifera MAFF 305830]